MRLILPIVLACILNLHSGAQFVFTDSAVTARIRHDVYVLADDSMLGRQAGTRGETKSIDFITGRLKEAGIQPWRSSGYLQPFTRSLIQITRVPRLEVAGKPMDWRYDFSLSSYSANDSVTASWVDCGTGIIIPSEGVDAFKGIEGISGKIALISMELPALLSRDKSHANELSPAFRIANAVERGAAGVIVYGAGKTDKQKLFDFSGSDSLMVPVMYTSQEAIGIIMKDPSAKLTMAAHLRRIRNNFSNIVAGIDNGAARTIVMGAHFDHLGKSLKPKDKGAYCVGADDNASGTEGILELARYYKAHRDTANNYIIVLFSAEEEGLLGSEYFVKQMSPGLRDSVNFMLNFDMIGRLGCEGMQVTAEAAGSSGLWKQLYRDVKHPGFSLRKVASSLPFSDQDAFYKRGIPVLYLTTGLHSLYHTPADKPETINFTGMTNIVKYAERLVNAAGSGKKVPYREIPASRLYLEMIGFVFAYIGESLSF